MAIKGENVSDQPDHAITWRTQVELTPDWDGYITRRMVNEAAAKLGDVAEQSVEIVVNGRLNDVAPDALVSLGCYLAKAERVDVVAHGRGVPALRQAIEFAIRQDLEWREFDEKRAQSHDSKPRG